MYYVCMCACMWEANFCKIPKFFPHSATTWGANKVLHRMLVWTIRYNTYSANYFFRISYLYICATKNNFICEWHKRKATTLINYKYENILINTNEQRTNDSSAHAKFCIWQMYAVWIEYGMNSKRASPGSPFMQFFRGCTSNTANNDFSLVFFYALFHFVEELLLSRPNFTSFVDLWIRQFFFCVCSFSIALNSIDFREFMDATAGNVC